MTDIKIIFYWLYYTIHKQKTGIFTPVDNCSLFKMINLARF